ncbi:NAD(P)/FAD-dependent oxidoreductase [Actinotalea sp. BY-33]|uniref:NAD(P)/FAD-dependent oxidoreductase n=1 Tax=Actinotalea soli TaxID=2819234 RepID=A0A939LP04_9CELL|nr:FAD-dependent oxidoreductase [Actinotalea soli]MBO1751686.1 NAD(P)/FAD-dependent oxidoreductase [Actinotalea soli]
MSSGPDVLDVLVVGGGPGGLSAALVLARARRRVVVVDAGEARNAAASHVHGYLGLDDTSPEDLRRRGRDEVARYGGVLRAGRVTSLRTASHGFQVGLADGAMLIARHVVVATGLRDELPEIPGLAERWGREVLHCPYCHGWEHSGERVVVLVTASEEVDKAFTLRQWTSSVQVVLHGLEPEDLEPEVLERLDAMDVGVRAGPVRHLVPTALPGSPAPRTDLAGAGQSTGRLTAVALADGSHVPCDAVVVQPRLRAQDELLADLGVPVQADAFGEEAWSTDQGRTGVHGLWAVGNVSELGAQVVAAAAAGHRAAVAIDHELTTAAVDAAVDARRSRRA